MTHDSYQLFLPLLNDYNHRTGIAELPLTPGKRLQIDQFLTYVVASRVMRMVEQKLTNAGTISRECIAILTLVFDYLMCPFVQSCFRLF